MTAARLAWSLCLVGALLIVTGPVLQAFAREGSLPYSLCIGAVQVACAVVGALVASRLPRNPVGWILLAIGTGLGVSVSLIAYGALGLRGDGLPADEIAVWVGEWMFTPFVFGGVMVLLHLFPNGRFVSGRWKVVCLLSGVVVLVAAVTDALAPGPLENLSSLDNPMAATGALADVVLTSRSIVDPLALPVFACAIAGLIVRLRRSTGVERQQIKWITYALALVAIGLALTAARPVASDVPFLLALLALAAVPVAAGIAILRYRLYDIDVLINRTLVYGALTALLGAAYLAGVLVLELVLSGLTSGNDLAIAGSTLGVAALLGPARRRIQATVNRRFYRRRYDAARTLAVFGAQVRNEVDLDELAAELRSVVAQTMQPAHVVVWLREP